MDDEITLRILSGTFGLWALVVAWGVAQVTKRIDAIGSTVQQLDKDLQRWVQTVESRLATVEERVRIMCSDN